MDYSVLEWPCKEKRENFGLNPETALTIHYGASLHCSSVSYCTKKEGFQEVNTTGNPTPSLTRGRISGIIVNCLLLKYLSYKMGMTSSQGIS